MNFLTAQIYKVVSKVKILHSLPGRIRIHIPLLKSLNNSRYMQYEVFLIQKLKEIEGVKSVSCCFITGNILIEYSQKILSQDEIIRWFDVIKDTLLEYFTSEKPMPDNIEQEKKLIAELANKIKNRIGRFE